MLLLFTKLRKHLFTAWTCQRGNVAMTMALVAIPLIVVTTGALEMYSRTNDKSRLQAAVDAGALAGANKLSIASYNLSGDVTTSALNSARQNVAGADDPSIFTFTAIVNEAEGTVTVNGQAAHKSLAGLIGEATTEIDATATAEALQKTPLCILQTAGGGISLANNSQIKAPGCLIHANQNIDVASSAAITAEHVQAAGTVKGPTYPVGNSGALPITDPFAGMTLYPQTGCTLGLNVAATPLTGDISMPAGVHCLPILVVGSARLHLLPGDHYFMGGLMMTQNSRLDGDDVALIFGPANIFNFADKATIRLSARKSGPFAGFLIATTRDNNMTFKISSDNVGELLGTIYIPNATLEVTSQGNVAQDSDWSIIVAQSLVLKNGPNLVINNRYIGSGVPVPEGVGPSNGTVLKQ